MFKLNGAYVGPWLITKKDKQVNFTRGQLFTEHSICYGGGQSSHF